jgi:hypothetical protein
MDVRRGRDGEGARRTCHLTDGSPFVRRGLTGLHKVQLLSVCHIGVNFDKHLGIRGEFSHLHA